MSPPIIAPKALFCGNIVAVSPPEGATHHPLLSPLRHCFAVILSPETLRVKCVDCSDWSRAVTSPFCGHTVGDLSMEAANLFWGQVVLR